jgi:hypothetical protein
MSSSKSSIPLAYRSDGERPPDWPGWCVVLVVAALFGGLMGSAIWRPLAWDRQPVMLVGTLGIACFGQFLGRHRFLTGLIGGVVLVSVALMTLTMRHWISGHWPRWHVDAKWPYLYVLLLLHALVATVVVSGIAGVVRWIGRRWRPGAAALMTSGVSAAEFQGNDRNRQQNEIGQEDAD